MIAKKFNYITQEYESYTLKDGLSYRTDKETLNCAGCGKVCSYEEAYASLVLYTEEGLRFKVCSSCYDAEWKERVKCSNKKE